MCKLTRGAQRGGDPSGAGSRDPPGWELTWLRSGPSRPGAGSVPPRSQRWELASAQPAWALSCRLQTRHTGTRVKEKVKGLETGARPRWLLPPASAIAAPAGKLLPAPRRSCRVPLGGGGETQSLRRLVLPSVACFSASVRSPAKCIGICLPGGVTAFHLS